MKMLILGEMALAFLAGVAAVALYAARSPWRESAMGRHLMAFMAVTTIEVGSLLALGLGLKVPAWLFLVGYGALDAVVLQRLWLLIKAQRGESTRPR